MNLVRCWTGRPAREAGMGWLKRLWAAIWYDELREYRKGVKLLERRLESPENSPEADQGEAPKS